MALVVALIGGCASKKQTRTDPTWEKRVLEVRRLHDRGAYSDAERGYRSLLDEADAPSDRRYIQLQLARLAADREDHEEALRRYRAVWKDAESGAIPARAMFEASELLIEDLEEPKRGRQLRRTLIRKYPASTWAENAVDSIANHYRERRDWTGLEETFRRLHDEAGESPVADDILYTLAIVLKRDADRPAHALKYFEQYLETYPDRTFVDDVEWEAANIYIDRQNWRRATSLLERTARRVDSSWLVGTFNSPHASKARYRLGFIHMTHLDDYSSAVEHFEQYLRDFPDNRRADDSVWHMANAYRLMGRPEKVRETYRLLLERYPESRYAPRARVRLEGGKSP